MLHKTVGTVGRKGAVSMRKAVLRALLSHRVGVSEKAGELERRGSGVLPTFSRILAHQGECWASHNMCDGGAHHFIFILKDGVMLAA